MKRALLLLALAACHNAAEDYLHQFRPAAPCNVIGTGTTHDIAICAVDGVTLVCSAGALPQCRVLGDAYDLRVKAKP